MRKKIIDLFEYRRLPLLIEFGAGRSDEAFYEELIELQRKIYDLDHILESSWETDFEALDQSREIIHDHLRDMGVEDDLILDYCQELKTYEKHELAIRSGVYPDSYDIKYFYFFKSCDVKMMRRLIYDRYPTLAEVVPLDSWRLFDFITEINDDVEDVIEDLTTINGNGYLISKILHGDEHTHEIFTDFIEYISDNNEDESHPHTISPYLLTQQMIEETTTLMQRMKDVSVTEARISTYF